MTTESLLECVVLEPKATADAAIIWLHGLGANGHDFPPIVPELGLPENHGIRFVFPHAPSIPVTINGNMVMPAWYDILSMESIREVDEAGVRLSAARTQALVEREIASGIPSERIILAGFSQGGAIAMHLGLRYPTRLAGMLLLSTYMACDGDVDQERAEANANTPIFQAHGVHDPVVHLPLGEAARDRLQAFGYPLEWHTYPMQHQVMDSEIQEIGRWIRKRLF